MSELPVSPAGKRDHQEFLQTCWEWAEQLDDPEPFDEWAELLARRMDRRAAEHAGGKGR